MPSPYDGKLVDTLLKEKDKERAAETVKSLEKLEVSELQLHFLSTCPNWS